MTEFRHQIHGPTGPIAIYTRRSSGTADTYYLHRDHLGSPELVTNATGTQIVKPSFGAFGERRGSAWTGTPSSGDWTAIGNTTRDGFTDHEHLDNVGLVHMNGRVYDPKIGRFLSPDLFIDWGLGTQGVNRYGYVGNNPLNRIDPSGFTACDPFGHGPIRVDGNDMPRFAEIVVRGAQFPPPPPGAFVTFGPMLDSSGRVFEMGTPGGGDYERQEVSELGEVTVTATRTGQKRHRPPPVVVFGGGPGGVGAAAAPDAGGPDPMKNTADHDSCVDRCRTGLEPAVQGAAGAAGGGVAGLVAGLRTPGAGTVALGLTGALAGGLTGIVTGSTAAGGASPATSASVGAGFGGAAATVGMMLTGRAPSVAGVLGGMWSGTVGGAAPAGALGAASSTGGGAAVGSMAANGPLATLIFASSAGATVAYLTYRFVDGIANRHCEGQCGE